MQFIQKVQLLFSETEIYNVGIILKLTEYKSQVFSNISSELKKMTVNPDNLLICFQTKKKRLYLHPLSRNNNTV